MSVTHQRITVSTTAVALNTTSSGGNTLFVRNVDASNAADLGSSSVTAGTGLPLPAATTIGPIDVDAGDQLFAIRSGAADVILAVVRV